jgi:ligand-binding SRPBCC domain-containing protein
VVAQVNDQYVKVARVHGEFVWHDHAGEDELFLVLRGRLRLDFEDRPAVTVGPGECYVVPRGVRHRPVADDETWVALVEPASTRHTGDEVTRAPARLPSSSGVRRSAARPGAAPGTAGAGGRSPPMHFARTLRVPHPAAELFAWHERPGAFERLAPPWQRVEVLASDRSVRDGARVTLRARVAPPALTPLFPLVDPLVGLVVPSVWEVEHQDYVPGRQFRDVMRRGPFAGGRTSTGWSPTARRQHARRPVDFALPLGAVGAAAGGGSPRPSWTASSATATP